MEVPRYQKDPRSGSVVRQAVTTKSWRGGEPEGGDHLWRDALPAGRSSGQLLTLATLQNEKMGSRGNRPEP